VQLSITANTRELEDRLYLLAKQARVDYGQVIREEARLIARNIQQLTPPASHAQGRASIRKDLFGGRSVRRSNGGFESSIGLFQKIGSSTLVPPRNSSTQTVGVNLGWEGSKNIRIMRKFWKPNASIAEMRAFHKRYQNPRTGRTGLVSRSMIGRWKVQDQMWVKDSVANQYLRELQSRVGWAKAAQAPVVQAAGGTVAAWIGRHSAASGSVDAKFDGDNPHVRSTGFDIKIPDYQRVVDNAVKNRERVTERKIDRLIAGRATNLGFVTILERK